MTITVTTFDPLRASSAYSAVIAERDRLLALNAKLVAALTDLVLEAEKAARVLGGMKRSPCVAGGLENHARYARAALAKVQP